jgi:hypothetical protein
VPCELSSVNSSGTVCTRTEANLIVAQPSVDDLYCNVSGLSSPTGDGIVDDNMENLKD